MGMYFSLELWVPFFDVAMVDLAMTIPPELKVPDDELERLRAENRDAVINSEEAAYYFKTFRKYHPQDSALKCIGIWTGFGFAEERQKVRGTVDGELKHPVA
mgnify:CR=1 FL=1